MQEALETPHFKKIWEEVIWKGRHPEAKSVEEALFLETYNMDCNVLHCGLNLIVSMQSLCLLRNSGLQLGDKQYHAFSQSFGRPITLEDIINLFTKQEINKGAGDVEIRIFTSGELVNLYNITITGYVETGEEPQYHYVGEFFYSITKPFHEQTPETWEKIANLI